MSKFSFINFVIIYPFVWLYTLKANYGAIEVDWEKNVVSMRIYTPHEATALAVEHNISLFSSPSVMPIDVARSAYVLAASNCQKLLIPGYFYPSLWTSGTEWEVLAGLGHEGIVILNPNSGPDSSVNSDYVTAVAMARAAGFKVIGYVHTLYGARSASVVKAEVDLYQSFYDIDGIFFDETSYSAADLAYYTDISDYVYSIRSNYLVALNPGSVPDEGYMNVADIIVSFEQSFEYYNTSYSAPSYVNKYPASKFAHLVHSTPTASWKTALDLSFERNAGYVFITDDIMPNPWDTLPPYIRAQTNATADNCGNCNVATVRRSIDWLRMQQSESGLLESFLSPSSAVWATNRAYAYDQAVAVIAFLLNAESKSSVLLNDARAILSAISSNILSDPSDSSLLQVPFSWQVDTLVSSGPYRSGTAAWVSEAFGLYQLLTGDSSYMHVLIGISKWLQKRLVASGTNNCVTGGPDVSWCSTEHNIDAYFALQLASHVTSDATFSASADVIASTLGGSLWHSSQNRFRQGLGDDYRALDCQSWGSIWLTADHKQPFDSSARVTDALSFLESNFQFVQRSYLTSEPTKGYGPYADSSNDFHSNCVWSEGTMGVAMAYLRNGQVTKLRELVHEMKQITSPDGGLLYAAEETVVNVDGSIFYPYPSVAGTGWLAMTCAAKQHVFWANSSSVYTNYEYVLGSKPKCRAAAMIDLLEKSYLNLTKGVMSVEISSGSQPGHIVLIKSTAFPLVMASDTAVVAAAGILQQNCGPITGRVVAFTHTGFISHAETDTTVNGVSTLMRNAVQWVSKSRRPTIALQSGSSAILDLANAQFIDFSYAVVSDSSVLAGGLAEYDMLFATADYYASEDLEAALRQFLYSGGGIIFYATPW